MANHWVTWKMVGGKLLSSPNCGKNKDGTLEVFGLGTDHGVWHRWQKKVNGEWSPWTSLGAPMGTQFNSRVAAANNEDGRLEVFVRAADNTIYHIWQHKPNKSWVEWAPLPGVKFASDPVVVRNKDGRLSLFGRGADNALYWTTQKKPNSPWVPWECLAGNFNFEPAFGVNNDGRLEAFVIGQDGGLQQTWQTG